VFFRFAAATDATVARAQKPLSLSLSCVRYLSVWVSSWRARLLSACVYVTRFLERKSAKSETRRRRKKAEEEEQRTAGAASPLACGSRISKRASLLLVTTPPTLASDNAHPRRRPITRSWPAQSARARAPNHMLRELLF
jgi:hypothetical protein